ncbi:hypothetical protein B0H13DRAFT_904060 [Mycena leptocephala]|nr:hypothetical protein B0H13DRAFT_904060 [Mycena leptocephala]
MHPHPRNAAAPLLSVPLCRSQIVRACSTRTEDILFRLASRLPSESVISFSAGYQPFHDVVQLMHVLHQREFRCFFLRTHNPEQNVCLYLGRITRLNQSTHPSAASLHRRPGSCTAQNGTQASTDFGRTIYGNKRDPPLSYTSLRVSRMWTVHGYEPQMRVAPIKGSTPKYALRFHSRNSLRACGAVGGRRTPGTAPSVPLQLM